MLMLMLTLVLTLTLTLMLAVRRERCIVADHGVHRCPVQAGVHVLRVQQIGGLPTQLRTRGV